jgi:uncharacterized membrane protein YphA (DoxX/SURF4 family)
MKKYLTLKNLGWVLTIIVSFMLGMSGISKIIGTQEMVNNFTSMNLLPYMALTGVLEVIGVIGLIIPKTSKYGAIILSSIMSGAVALHLSLMGGAGFFIPMILGALALGGYCLRSNEYKNS